MEGDAPCVLLVKKEQTERRISLDSEQNYEEGEPSHSSTNEICFQERPEESHEVMSISEDMQLLNKHDNLTYINRLSPEDNSLVLNCEQVMMGATADESMAVEALSQLGGMFNITDIHEVADTECGDLAHLCESCGMQFLTMSELQGHITVCRVLSPSHIHVCSVCGDCFDQKSDLSNHFSRHQGATNHLHICRICSSSFTRKSDLLNHMSSHQMSRPHQCPECGVDFQRPSSLTNHMKIHKYHPGRFMLSQMARDANSIKSSNPKSPGQTQESDTIPLIAFHETDVVGLEENKKPNMHSLAGLPSYDSWNSKASNVDTSNDTINANVSYQVNIPFNQLDGTSQDMEQFNYFQDIIECTTVDVETTVMSSNIVEDDSIDIKDDTALDFDVNSFDNAAVKVEAVPYFLPEENDSIKAVYSVDVDAASPEEAIESHQHQCMECDEIFTELKSLQEHSRTCLKDIMLQDSWGNDPLQVIRCFRCSESFSNEVNLRHHQQYCADSKKVPVLAQNDHSNVNCRKTALLQAKSGKHHCDNCDKKFTTKQKLFRHMWIHRKKHYLCEICSASLSTQDELDTHRRSEHPGDPPFVCQTCGKSFASRQGVWEHRRVHGTAKVSLFWCHECNKSFSSRQGYLIHTRTHTGERPYGCRFCMKAFRDGGTLRKHERIHTGERPHVCPLCDRAFNQKVVLREHVRWVHAANRSGVDNEEHVYMCQVCGVTLGDREELCAHIVKHSDDLAKAAKNKEHPVAVPVNNSIVKAKHVNNSTKLKKKKKKRTTEETVAVPEFVPLDIVTHNAKSRASSKRLTYQLEVAATTIKKDHTCGMCDETFIDKVQLMDHVRIHI